jgi:signal transduction histidine kinase
VVDDGKGFDLADARQRGAGLGLVSMEERARLAAGEIHIDTGHGQGTTVRVHIAADSSTVSERDVSVSSGARP